MLATSVLVGLFVVLANPNIPVRSDESLPGELDYGHYMVSFRKSHDRSDLASRARLFLSRTLKISEHNVLFSRKEKSYFLAQNQFTDLRTDELRDNSHDNDNGFEPIQGAKEKPDLPANRYYEQRQSGRGDGYSRASEQDLADSDDNSRPATLDLTKEASLKGTAELFKVLKEDPELANRVAKYVKLGENSEVANHSTTEVDAAAIRIRSYVQSNNPNYDLGALTSFGSHTDLPETFETFGQNYANMYLDDYNLDPFDDGDYESGPTLLESLKSFYNSLFEKEEEAEKPQEETKVPLDGKILYKIDWRKIGCISPAKSQGPCNACYAFSVLSLMEYFYCRQTKELTDFSAQYVVDCGHHVGLKGCKSGKILAVGLFIKRFGLELESIYPYTQKQAECPLEVDKTPDDKFGYLRPQITHWQKFEDISDWYKWLRKSPLLVGISMPADFEAYGGGIHDGKNCVQNATHAMLLVGSGSQNGQDFWLLKNSFSNAWGEDGYFRLSKAAPLKCFNSAIVVRAQFRGIPESRTV